MEDWGFKGFGARRKRNINSLGPAAASSGGNKDTTLSISWPTPSEESKKHLSVRTTRFGQPVTVNSEQQKPPLPARVQRNYPERGELQKSYVQLSGDTPVATKRITIHLPVALVETMKAQKRLRLFPSVSWLIQEAVEHYLASRSWIKSNSCQ